MSIIRKVVKQVEVAAQHSMKLHSNKPIENCKYPNSKMHLMQGASG
jgi:hypothetical protein